MNLTKIRTREVIVGAGPVVVKAVAVPAGATPREAIRSKEQHGARRLLAWKRPVYPQFGMVAVQ